MLTLLAIILVGIVLAIIVIIMLLVGGVVLIPVLLIAADILVCVGLLTIIAKAICASFDKDKEKKKEINF